MRPSTAAPCARRSCAWRTWRRAGRQDAGVEPPGRTATCVIADAASAVFFIHPPGFFPHAGETPAFSLEVSIMSNIASDTQRSALDETAWRAGCETAAKQIGRESCRETGGK